jgi:hypothetical protein
LVRLGLFMPPVFPVLVCAYVTGARTTNAAVKMMYRILPSFAFSA